MSSAKLMRRQSLVKCSLSANENSSTYKLSVVDSALKDYFSLMFWTRAGSHSSTGARLISHGCSKLCITQEMNGPSVSTALNHPVGSVSACKEPD